MLARRWSVSNSTIYEVIRNGPLQSFVWRASFCGSPLKKSRDMKTAFQPRGSQVNEMNVRGCRWLSSSGAGPSRSDEAWEIFGSSSFSGFENRLFQKLRALPLSPGQRPLERTNLFAAACTAVRPGNRCVELAGYGGYPAGALSCFRRIRFGRMRKLRTRSSRFSNLYCALAFIKCVLVASLRGRRGAQGHC